ncbi:hypothetical protein BOTBODRAFT_27572 [Botryobasidium botryosum FD-172 SS1]|uniref:RRM domain-containing protein n=1 Tax=Botryobasidium botryosum (strain FD-172 SS1) TaxID=930990 RepID=A0A067MWN8_BOTB1|nr:hypothetical protein BOTBODRAFT_27572 [Botryobasidium botryosum FD-172 SS1]
MRMTDHVVDICNQPWFREEFERLTDQQVRSALGFYGEICGIHRYTSYIKQPKPKALHLFIEFRTAEIARAVLKHQQHGWLFYPIYTRSPLYKAYLSFKTGEGRDPVWGPGVTVPKAPPVESPMTASISETAHPSPSPTSTRVGDTPHRDTTPNRHYGGTTSTHHSEPKPKLPPTGPRLSSRAINPAHAVSPTQSKHTHYTYPSTSPSKTSFNATSSTSASYSARRHRDPEENHYSLPPYKKPRRTESAQIDLESFGIAQARLRYSELASRTQTVEDERAALEKRVAELEQEKEVLEVLEKSTAEQARQDTELREHCDELEQQLLKAAMRETEETAKRERKDAEHAAREAELVLRCGTLEEELRLVRQDQLAMQKEKEQMQRLIDGAFIVPSLRDAFVQIDQLLQELVCKDQI